MRASIRRAGWLALGTLFFLASCKARAAEDSPKAAFYRGYYLQSEQRDLEAAAEAFEQVAGAETAPDDLRRRASERLAAIREDQVDFARLMPPDALAYVELTAPGEHLERLLQMLGLFPAPGDEPHRPQQGIPVGDGLFLPEQFTISPALAAELKEFRGVAAAMTSYRENFGPLGVIVVHPGDSNLLRGLIETAVQVLPPAEPVHGFPAWRLLKDGWIVQTNRMFVISPVREEVEAALARLHDPQLDSLASREALQQLKGRRADAVLFAYLDGRKVVDQVYSAERLRDDARIARVLLDLDHIESLTACMGVTDAGLRAELQLNLAEGHRNLPYALIRTAPLSRRSLECVPAGAAGVALIGLNPPDHHAAQADVQTRPLSAMDIGREVFANIDEISLFTLPGTAGAIDRQPVPDVGLIISSQDPARSAALWTQLLTLPAAVAAPQVQGPVEVTVGNHHAQEFRFADAPAIVLVRMPECGVILGTQGAVTAAVSACEKGSTITADAEFEPLLQSLTQTSSKALLVDVSRALEMAISLGDGRDGDELQTARALLDELRLSLITDEAPTSFTLRIEAAGLPDVPDIFRALTERHHER